MARKRREREKHIELCRSIITEKLDEGHIRADVLGRPKHFYSIYKKMKRQNIPFDSVYDLAGVRIICQENEDKNCYHALGIVHTLWTPIDGRFRDWVLPVHSSNTFIGDEGGDNADNYIISIVCSLIHKGVWK